MGVVYERLLRPALFRFDPEKAHDIGTTALDYLSRLRFVCGQMAQWNQPADTKPIELFGLSFPNMVGLAAGMDKNGRFWRVGSALGFGHVEIGTVTAQRQPGNERPRMFRYPAERAVINRMGFNNDGAEEVAARLKTSRKGSLKHCPVLGINIGKSRVVSVDEAVPDYLSSFSQLAPYADYLAVNVSSPNTPDLRQLQGDTYLPTLLSELVAANRQRARRLGDKPVPLLLKIAPDLTFVQIDQILATALECEVDGLIATNTTIARPGTFARVDQAGGLSGKPLHRRAVDVVKYCVQATKGKLPVIGVGGIDGPATAGAMVDAGASLVQFYTGMIYRGPFLAAEIAQALAPRQRTWIARRQESH